MWIKDYYCPHCGQFRGKGQVYIKDNGGLTKWHLCRYCDRGVIRTDNMLVAFFEKNTKEKAKIESK